MAPDAPRPAPVKARSSRIKDSTSYKVFTVVNMTLLVLMCAVMLYPFLMLLAQSFSSAGAINAGKDNLFPVDFNLDTYRAVANNSSFWRSYGNTVVYTVLGTTIAMVLTTTYAFVLSKKHLKGRGLLIGIAVFIWPFFAFLDAGPILALPLMMILGMNILHDAIYGPQAAWFAEQFPLSVRYTGVSVGYQIGTVLSGGLTPVIASSLLLAGNDTPWLICLYITVLCGASLVAALAAKEPVRDRASLSADTLEETR